MGLDTTHDCYHGSCRGFNAFRCEIAGALDVLPEGVVLDATVLGGYTVTKSYPDQVLFGDWTGLTYDDPLEVLFCHSDCDGDIFPADMPALIERLQGIQLEGRSQWKLRQFIIGLEAALQANEKVEFH